MTKQSVVNVVIACLEAVTCEIDPFLLEYRLFSHLGFSLETSRRVRGSNMIYDPDLKCRALTYFDVSFCNGEPRVIGTDKKDTILAFTAIDLLTEAY